MLVCLEVIPFVCWFSSVLSSQVGPGNNKWLAECTVGYLYCGSGYVRNLLCLVCILSWKFLLGYSVALEAMQEFLKHTQSEVMSTFLDNNNAWTMLEKEDTCAHGMLHLARSIHSKEEQDHC